MATQDTYADLGFQSLDEVAKAKLGAPVSVYMIQLDELKKLDLAADPLTGRAWAEPHAQVENLTL